MSQGTQNWLKNMSPWGDLPPTPCSPELGVLPRPKGTAAWVAEVVLYCGRACELEVIQRAGAILAAPPLDLPLASAVFTLWGLRIWLTLR